MRAGAAPAIAGCAADLLGPWAIRLALCGLMASALGFSNARAFGGIGPVAVRRQVLPVLNHVASCDIARVVPRFARAVQAKHDVP